MFRSNSLSETCSTPVASRDLLTARDFLNLWGGYENKEQKKQRKRKEYERKSEIIFEKCRTNDLSRCFISAYSPERLQQIRKYGILTLGDDIPGIFYEHIDYYKPVMHELLEVTPMTLADN